MKTHTARSLHPILKLREAGQEEDSGSPSVTQLQGRWGKNVTPFAWASKSVLFCYSDSSITKQRFLGETVPDLILNRKKLVSKVKVAKILEEKNIILAERREGGQKRALICVCWIHTGNRIKIKDESVREYSLDTFSNFVFRA